MLKLVLWCAVLFVIALFVSGAVLGYPAYYNVEIEELLNRYEETMFEQDRELTRSGNELKIQYAYTEHLKIVLEANDIEYERYPDFLDKRLFRGNELDDPEYLYTYTLDLDYLLMLATNLGGIIDEEGDYITPNIPFEN